MEDVRVYVFNATGAYMGINGLTDGLGGVSFRLPEGDYNFRADYLGSRYWSGHVNLIPHVSNPVSVSTGGGIFSATILKGESQPLDGLTCYLFSESGAYLGLHEVTSEQGDADFNLADGAYKLRVDYLGSQFWTETFTIPDTLALAYTIPHQDVTVTVNGECAGDVLPFEDLPVYLFSASGAYLSVTGKTDALGQISFNLPELEFKVRVDYLGRPYWSEVFTWHDKEVIVHEGVAEIHAVQDQNPLPGVNIYVFDENGAYLGMISRTDENGMVSFRLPEGIYRFRADYQSSQYWVTETVDAGIINEIHLNTGGGAFSLTLEKAQGDPLVDAPVYVFTQSGAYIGINARTNDQGRVAFDLSEGCYTFRTDYLGYQFWTEPLEVPQTLSHVLTIPHQDITLAVNKVFGTESTPLENIKTYLFTEGGAYQGLNAVTNTQGLVSFSLPEKPFKVRADYLGAQYWSEVFSWEDRAVNIDHGQMRLHVTRSGTDVENAPVYLFTEQGSYLGLNEKTGVDGEAVFSIPARTFKFRVDYEGTQYWTEGFNILAHEETIKEVIIEQLALDLTNNPRLDRFDGKPPTFKAEPIRVASIGSLTGLLVEEETDPTPREKVYYFINDHLGTPRKLMDETGSIVWSADYQPFGAANNITGSVDNNFRFPGQYYDEETGLHYNYHRYYDRRTGRYLRADPIGLSGGTNIFTYVNNNPINNSDTLGLWTFGFDFAGTAGAGIGSTGGWTYVIDSRLNIAKIRHFGGGGFFGVAAGGTAQIQWTNAPTVQELIGASVSTGGSYGPKFIEATGEWIVMPAGYQGLNVGLGTSVGPSPIEFHCIVEDSEIVWRYNPLEEAMEKIGNWLKDVLEVLNRATNKAHCE